MTGPYGLAEINGRPSPDRVRLVVDVALPFELAWSLLAAIKNAAAANPPERGGDGIAWAPEE